MTLTSTYTDDENDAYLVDVAERLTDINKFSCLPDPMPTWAEMVDWMQRGLCPKTALREAERRCMALYGWTTLGQLSDLILLANEPDLVLGASVPKEMVITNAEDEEDETKLDVIGETQSEWGWIPGMPHRHRDWDVYETDDEMFFDIVLHPPEVMADLLQRNERLQKEDRLSSPLFPLINAFLKRPMPVEPNRKPARIMPSRIAMARVSDRRVPERFSPPAHVQRTKGGQMLITGFESVQAPSPALPLALYDLGGGPNDGKGEGAPLALRIFVESILALPQEARNGQRREVQISLREFLSWIGIDNPDALRRQSRYLDQVRRAIEALDKAWIPIYNPITNEHRIERVVLVQGLPTGRGALEKSVTIYISLPPGSENGPLIPPTLRTWGKRSAGAYRLLLNLCYNWFRPGVTRRPASQPGRKEFWYQSQNPDDYEPMTPSEVLRMAFPNSGGKNRSEMTSRAMKALKDLAKDEDVQIMTTTRGLIIMPPTSAAGNGGMQDTA